eukprot:Filipodium_phascolosomae@DN778_c0_g1_i1.p1
MAFSQLYGLVIEEYLDQGLVNTEQQVIYSAANQDLAFLDMIQPYKSPQTEDWFYLGRMMMYNAGSCKMNDGSRPNFHALEFLWKLFEYYDLEALDVRSSAWCLFSRFLICVLPVQCNAS